MSKPSEYDASTSPTVSNGVDHKHSLEDQERGQFDLDHDSTLPDVAHVPFGVQKVEAAQAVWTTKTRWILFGA